MEFTDLQTRQSWVNINFILSLLEDDRSTHK